MTPLSNSTYEQQPAALPLARPLRAGYSEWAWAIPFAAALYYPWGLKWANASIVLNHGLTLGGLLSLVSAYLTPIVGFYCLYRLGKQEVPTDRLVLARRLSHLAVAAPPAYTLLGVLLYLMKIYGHDIGVWTALWAALTVLSAMLVQTTLPRPASLSDPDVYRKLRMAHGIASLAILLVFLGPHLFNHMFGIFGVDAHRTIMKALRVVYRQGLVEPILIAAFFFQIISGLVLIRPKTARRTDLLDALQTASGIYLTFFIASHINSVFILARYFGTETDYAWAVGEPVGLVKDAWNIRLLPHYSLGVFLILCHLACGLRVVMAGHGVSKQRAATITWAVIGVGAVVTTVITAGMLGVRVG